MTLYTYFLQLGCEEELEKIKLPVKTEILTKLCDKAEKNAVTKYRYVTIILVSVTLSSSNIL